MKKTFVLEKGGDYGNVSILVSGAEFSNPIPILLDHNPSELVGCADVEIIDNEIRFTPHKDLLKDYGDRYPSIGYTTIQLVGSEVARSRVISIGLAKCENEDPAILKLKDQ